MIAMEAKCVILFVCCYCSMFVFSFVFLSLLLSLCLVFVIVICFVFGVVDLLERGSGRGINVGVRV